MTKSKDENNIPTRRTYPLSIEEKPKDIRPCHGVYHMVQTHLFFYGPDVLIVVKTVAADRNGERGVSELHKRYLEQNRFHMIELEDRPGSRWFWDDAGTKEKLDRVSRYVKEYQRITGDLMGSPHLEAFRNGWLKWPEIDPVCRRYEACGYGVQLRAACAELQSKASSASDVYRSASGLELNNRA
jgi:dTDP-glucose pyrophosphorylase